MSCWQGSNNQKDNDDHENKTEDKEKVGTDPKVLIFDVRAWSPSPDQNKDVLWAISFDHGHQFCSLETKKKKIRDETNRTAKREGGRRKEWGEKLSLRYSTNSPLIQSAIADRTASKVRKSRPSIAS